MAFVKFTEPGRSYAAKASVSKTGMLSFSDGCRRRFQMNDYTHCVLYYDADTRRIGVELTNDASAEGVRKMRLRETGSDVAAKSFVDYFDLGIRETIVCPVDRDEETGYLVVDLTKCRKRGGQKSESGRTGT